MQGLENTFKSQISYSPERFEFERLLSEDMRSIGFRTELVRMPGKIQFLACIPREAAGKHIQQKLRKIQLEEKQEFLQEMNRAGVLDKFICGRQLRVDSIKPVIRPCETRKEAKIFNYCKLLQSIPSFPRVGRRMRFLVYDSGQSKLTIMGAFSLASTPYTIGDRDDFLDWRGRANIEKKNRGLRHIMDLAICMATPPYNLLLGGKLIAMLPFSSQVKKLFAKKYGNPLLAVTTTCSTGIHCPIFNRIGITSGGLYKRIGKTRGYSTMMFSNETLRSARHLIESETGRRLDTFASTSKPVRILRSALRICEIPEESVLRLGNPKGIYLGALESAEIDSLRKDGGSDHGQSIRLEEITCYWYANKASKRMGNAEIMADIREFDPQSMKVVNDGNH